MHLEDEKLGFSTDNHELNLYAHRLCEKKVPLELPEGGKPQGPRPQGPPKEGLYTVPSSPRGLIPWWPIHEVRFSASGGRKDTVRMPSSPLLEAPQRRTR